MNTVTQRSVPVASRLTWDLLVASGLLLACISARLIVAETMLLPEITRMALLWPPTVFVFVALVLSPYRRWWLLVAASVLAAWITNGETPLAAKLTMEAANSAQALTIAFALRWLRFQPEDLMKIRGMVAFLVVAVCLGPLAFSLGSAALLSSGGWIDGFGTNWVSRCITNMLTAITLAPPLLLLFARHGRISSTALLEGAVLLAAIPFVEIVVTATTTELIGFAAALLYLPLPFFLWAAVRLGPAGVSLAAVAILMTRIYLETPIARTVLGAEPSDGLLTLELFVIAMTVPFLLLSVIVHERRKTEAALRSGAERHRIATAAGRVGAWDWNLVSNEIRLDPSLKAMLGYREEEIGNRMEEWGEHVHHADRPRVAASVEAHLERGEPFEIEHRMMHRDGSIRWFLARGSVVERDDSGKPTRMMGTDVDVTERRHIEDALQALRSGIHQSGRTEGMNALAASVAHEVSQPLFAIVANAQACLKWLEKEHPDLEEVREAVRDIVESGERASGVIDRTRAMFRQRSAEQQPVSVPEVITVSIDIMRRQLQDAEITVMTDCPPGLPNILGDQVQLQQVLDNLIANAIDALRNAEPPRSLTIEAREESGSVILTVHDSGCGIDRRHLDHIFDPFFSTRRGGLGLGLAISRSIILAHGGKIRAAPGPNSGTSFEISLPLAEPRKKTASVPA